MIHILTNFPLTATETFSLLEKTCMSKKPKEQQTREKKAKNITVKLQILEYFFHILQLDLHTFVNNFPA